MTINEHLLRFEELGPKPPPWSCGSHDCHIVVLLIVADTVILGVLVELPADSVPVTLLCSVLVKLS